MNIVSSRAQTSSFRVAVNRLGSNDASPVDVIIEHEDKLKLLQAPRSPFCVKVRLVLAELDLSDAVTMVDTNPWRDETIRNFNPLCKVPILLLDDGAALHDSPVICEFLNEHVGGELIPRAGPNRWAVLSAQATADGLAESVVRRHVESLRPEDDHNQAVLERQGQAITAALNSIESRVAAGHGVVNLADLAAVAAIHYLDRRSPEILWRHTHPRLSEWLDEQLSHPRAVRALEPPALPGPGTLPRAPHKNGDP